MQNIWCIGVERIDYTKGLIEKFLAIERFLEKYPAYQGKFTLGANWSSQPCTFKNLF